MSDSGAATHNVGDVEQAVQPETSEVESVAWLERPHRAPPQARTNAVQDDKDTEADLHQEVDSVAARQGIRRTGARGMVHSTVHRGNLGRGSRDPPQNNSLTGWLDARIQGRAAQLPQTPSNNERVNESNYHPTVVDFML